MRVAEKLDWKGLTDIKPDLFDLKNKLQAGK
jgi:hypothetical protein